MKPDRLTLHNFTSYRDAELEFNGCHVAAIVGQNGHGKSSLLDAMTWALFGEGRTSDDNLIRRGADEMTVTFEFSMNGTAYTITRRKRRGGRHTCELRNDAGFVWNDGVKITQDAIDAALGLSHETFIHTAFLLQGQADRFTSASPGRRKEVLCEVLGLAVYELLATKAREIARQATTDQQTAEARIADTNAELGEMEGIEDRIAAAAAEEEKARFALSLAKGKLAAEEEKARELERVATRVEHAEAAHDAANDRIGQLTHEIGIAEAALQPHTETLGRGDEIRDRAKQLEGVEAELEASRVTADRYNHLTASIREREHEIELERVRLRESRDAIIIRKSALEAVTSVAPHLRTEIAERAAKIVDVGDLDADLVTARDKERSEHTRVTSLEHTIHTIRDQIAELKFRMGLLADHAECPTCHQVLPDPAVLGRQFADEELALSTKLAAAQTDQDKSRSLLRAISGTVAILSTQRDELQQMKAQQAIALDKLATAENAERELIAADAELARLAAVLDAQEYCPEARAAINTLTRERDALNWDADAHNQLAAAALELRPAREALTALLVAIERAAALHNEIDEKTAARNAAAEEVQKWAAEIELARIAITNIGDVSVGAVRAAVEDAEQQLALRVKRVAELGAVVDRRNALRVKRDELIQLHTTAAGRVETYSLLAEGWGKTGAPALIIESVLPQLEDEANSLLGQLTDGLMRIELTAQREKRDGTGMIETLDVIIHAPDGVSPYESYSGGERFRIDFALRLALSRLLASRAGTQIRTLVIDEGFGSQDASGREHLIEAIASISDQFDCILVITHVEELQDAFPTRIIVSKGQRGSEVRVA